MDNSDVIILLTVVRTTDASGTQIESIADRRRIFCQISSVSMKETYTAMAVGRNPELRAKIAEAAEYAGEQFAAYRGDVFRVVRTYRVGTAIELTLERTRDLEGMV